jgi:hypothetical protein
MDRIRNPIDEARHVGERAHMHDEGIGRGTALRGKETLHCRAIERVHPETVDSLCRERDEPAIT